MPERIQRRRTAGWRMPDGAAYVGRGTRWGNPFAFRSATTGLVRVPGVLTGRDWEFEGRISGHGTRHDFHHGDGRIDVVHVRWATAEELVELYRRALLREDDASFRAAWGPAGWPMPRDVTSLYEVRRVLAGRDLACWCPLDQPCHADVLLDVANRSGGAR